MIATLYFTYGFVTVALVLNALRAPSRPSHRVPPMWLPAMVASEAAGLWLWVVAILSFAAAAAGGIDHGVGQIGLGMAGVAWIGQLEVWRRSRVGAAEIGTPVAHHSRFPHRLLYLANPAPPGVDRSTHAFAKHPHRPGPLELDLYRATGDDHPAPLVIWVHGGGWQGGSRRLGGKVVIHHLARHGWAVAAIDYPLSPTATFPEHLIGIDATIEWASARPDLDGTIVLMGASAGAHLAATAALTRPGVDGMIGLYGIYDFLNRRRVRQDWPLIPQLVMKTTPDLEPARYSEASPIDLVGPTAPPVLLISPDFDSLVPPAESSHFAAALEEGGAAVSLLKVGWGQHGFDTFAGLRGRAVAGAIERWLADQVGGSPDLLRSPDGWWVD